jgi:hypothetical protein
MALTWPAVVLLIVVALCATAVLVSVVDVWKIREQRKQADIDLRHRLLDERDRPSGFSSP